MNTVRTHIVLVSILAVVLCSTVPHAAAYDSAINAFCELGVVINGGVISTPEDVDDITAIAANTSKGDDHTYGTVEGPGSKDDEGNDCPSVFITSPSKNDSGQGDSIVGTGEGFNLTVTVPKGVEYCFRLTLKTVLANQTIKVSVDGYSNSINQSTNWMSNSKDVYVCLVNGKLSTVNAKNSQGDTVAISDSMWLKSDDEPSIITLEGSRGKISIFGEDYNVGDLEVQLIIKNGQIKPTS